MCVCMYVCNQLLKLLLFMNLHSGYISSYNSTYTLVHTYMYILYLHLEGLVFSKWRYVMVLYQQAEMESQSKCKASIIVCVHVQTCTTYINDVWHCFQCPNQFRESKLSDHKHSSELLLVLWDDLVNGHLTTVVRE